MCPGCTHPAWLPREPLGWLRLELFLGVPLSGSSAQTQLFCHQGQFQALSAVLENCVPRASHQHQRTVPVGLTSYVSPVSLATALPSLRRSWQRDTMPGLTWVCRHRYGLSPKLTCIFPEHHATPCRLHMLLAWGQRSA